MSENMPQAGWYDDNNIPNQRRYWDGTRWTDHTQVPAMTAQALAVNMSGAMRPGNGNGTAGGVLGIVSLAGTLLFIPFTFGFSLVIGLILSLVGLPLAATGHRRAQALNLPTGMSVAGVVLNSIVLAIVLLVFFLAVAGVA